MAAATYAEFRQELFDRHRSPITSALSTVGDALLGAGVVVAVVKGDRRWLGRGLFAGLATASIAHLFQPGTLRAEYAGILRHPRWAVRAERERVSGAFAR